MSWRSAIWISSAAPDPNGCLCCGTGAEAPVLFPGFIEVRSQFIQSCEYKLDKNIALRPEDPRRIRAFRDALHDVVWDKANTIDSLSKLFQAVDDLAIAEVDYYYRRRGARAWISGVTRFGAWIFGTVGLLLPLLVTTKNQNFNNLENYGYVFLASAASCLAANSLFGGTEGHIRFVSTQLEIEKLVTQARISWFEYLASQDVGNSDYKPGFLLIQNYASDLHTITIEETGQWGKALLQELAKYQKQIEEKNAAAKNQ